MKIPHNIPQHATRIEYEAGGHVGVIYVWKSGDSFYWEANGNNGEEPTLSEATYKAKAWIRDGSKSTKEK